MAGRIAVIGSTNTDLVTRIAGLPGPGETLQALGFQMGPGGKGANQAVAAARLGAQVLLVGRVGDDLFGANTLRDLAAAGIDTTHVGTVPGCSSGVATILVDQAGENRILIVAGANEHVRPADIDRAGPDLQGCGMILLQLEIPLDTVYHAIDWGHRHGVPVLLNPAPAAPALDLDRIRHATFLVPNQTELALLTGLPAGTAPEAEAAARALLVRGLARVIVTLGAQGALLVDQDGARHVPAVLVRPVDTTGAGDAYIGSFAHHYLQNGGDLAAAMAAAGAYASLSITRPGAQASYPTAAEFADYHHSL